MKGGEESDNRRAHVASQLEKLVLNLEDVLLDEMVHEEFTPELRQHNPKAETNLDSRHCWKCPSENSEHNVHLVKYDDNDPFHQVSIELDVQTLIHALDFLLPDACWSSHRHGALITHVADQVKFTFFVIRTLFPLDLACRNLLLVGEGLISVECQLKQ